MTNPDRIASRVVGLIITGLSFIFDNNHVFTIFLLLLMLFAPLLYLPVSLLLRKFGSLVARFFKHPALMLVYGIFIIPYGLIISLFVKNRLHVYRSISVKKLDFDNPG
jgi:hypothetical protein